MSNLKDVLLKFGRELVRVDLPELPDVELYVKGLTAGDRLVIEEIRKDGALVGDHELCYLGAVDSTGQRIFTPEEAKNLDGGLAGKIAVAVLTASGLVKESAEAARKNSPSSPS